MLDSARCLRLQARRFENRRKPTGTRYSSVFRTAAAAHAHAEVRAGVAVARIARDLGLRPKTLTLWMRRMPASQLRPVGVERPVPMSTVVTTVEARPVLVTPSGVRVEGLDLDGIVQLMRALA